MSKLLKIALACIGVLVTLVLVAVVVLVFVVDPNQYRSVIEDAVYENTGLELNIAGNLSLAFRPYVGVTLSDVRLRNPDRPQELASSSSISLRVQPMSLLSGPLVVQELRSDDLHVNWYVDESGTSYWQTEQLGQLSQPSETEPGVDETPLVINFNFIAIDNASVDIQNLQQGFYYSIQNLDFDSQGSNLEGRVFPAQANFELVDHTAPAPWPVTMSTSNRIDLEAGEIDIENIQLALSPALLEGSVRVRNLAASPTWEGEFNSNVFALDELVANLGEEPQPSTRFAPGSLSDPAQQMQLRLRASGDNRQVQIPELVIVLGDMRFETDANIRFASALLPTNIRFDLQSNALDLTPYSASSEAQVGEQPAFSGTQPAQTNPGPEDIAVPVDFLRSANIQGSVELGSLFAGGIQYGAINLFVNLESGVLDIEAQPVQALAGTLAGNLRINSATQPSELLLQTTASGLNLEGLELPLLEPGAVMGRLNVQARYTSQGETVNALLSNLDGATSFAVVDNSVDIGVIKQVFATISALSPRGEAIQQWPDVVRFSEFGGYVLFENGLAENQQIKVRMDNFDITGSGGFDLAERTFDYGLLFTVLGDPFAQTIPINPSYHDVSWPVQCGAGFDDPINRFCRPDLAQVRELFVQIGNNSLQRRLDEVIDEEVPESLQEPAQGLLRNLFRRPQ